MNRRRFLRQTGVWAAGAAWMSGLRSFPMALRAETPARAAMAGRLRVPSENPRYFADGNPERWPWPSPVVRCRMTASSAVATRCPRCKAKRRRRISRCTGSGTRAATSSGAACARVTASSSAPPTANHGSSSVCAGRRRTNRSRRKPAGEAQGTGPALRLMVRRPRRRSLAQSQSAAAMAGLHTFLTCHAWCNRRCHRSPRHRSNP